MVTAQVIGGDIGFLERLLVSIEASKGLTPSTDCKANMRAEGSCSCCGFEQCAIRELTTCSRAGTFGLCKWRGRRSCTRRRHLNSP